MRQIFLSLVRPHMNYCTQLTAPQECPYLDKLKELVYDFSNMIPEIWNHPYDVTRKCITGIVPNIGISVRRNTSSRNGTKLEIPLSKETSSKRRNSIHIRGPELFNSLPSYLRDLTISQDSFKSKLDEYLTMIPDIPRLGIELRSLHSNRLDHVIRQWEWKFHSQPRYPSNSKFHMSGGAATYLVN